MLSSTLGAATPHFLPRFSLRGLAGGGVLWGLWNGGERFFDLVARHEPATRKRMPLPLAHPLRGPSSGAEGEHGNAGPSVAGETTTQ